MRIAKHSVVALHVLKVAAGGTASPLDALNTTLPTMQA
jgi:hypothetical protein